MTIRVAVTGIGAISALGPNIAAHTSAIRAGTVGIGPIANIPTERLKTKIAAEVRGFDPAKHFEPRHLPLLDRTSQLALVASREAMSDAGPVLDGVDPDRAGVIFGAAVGHHTLDDGYLDIYEKQATRVHPFTVPRVMASAPASNISMEHKVRGPTFSIASACASAAHAIGQAFHMVRAGMLDVAVTGGTEALIAVGVVKSWEALRVLTQDTCRPFSRDRSGLVLGEGAGVLVLENLDRARARGARVHGEIVGFGMNADAAEITAPDPATAARAIAGALRDGGIEPAQVGYVNAHGTATLLNDKSEAAALATVFGALLDRLPVSSSKSMHGHCLSAAAALEAIITVIGLRDGFLPPTMNFRAADPDCPIDCVPNASRPASVEVALSNAFAFGGLNAVLAFRRFEA